MDQQGTLVVPFHLTQLLTGTWCLPGNHHWMTWLHISLKVKTSTSGRGRNCGKESEGADH